MAESESGGERTEDPTAKKLSDARNKGQIARSKELGTMFVLVGSASAMLIVGGYLVDALKLMMSRLFSITREEAMDIRHYYCCGIYWKYYAWWNEFFLGCAGSKSQSTFA